MRPLQPTTDTERYFFGQLAPVLEPGEHVLACAYLLPRIQARSKWHMFPAVARARAAFVAITEHRVIFVETRLGVGAPLLENQRVEVLERSAIAGAAIEGNLLVLANTAGELMHLVVKRSTRYVTAQDDFFGQVTTWWPRSAAIEVETARLRNDLRRRRLLLAAAVVLGVAVFVYQLAAGG